MQKINSQTFLLLTKAHERLERLEINIRTLELFLSGPADRAIDIQLRGLYQTVEDTPLPPDELYKISGPDNLYIRVSADDLREFLVKEKQRMEIDAVAQQSFIKNHISDNA